MDTTVLGNTTLTSYAFMYVKPKIYYSDHSADLKKNYLKVFGSHLVDAIAIKKEEPPVSGPSQEQNFVTFLSYLFASYAIKCVLKSARRNIRF